MERVLTDSTTSTSTSTSTPGVAITAAASSSSRRAELIAAKDLTLRFGSMSLGGGCGGAGAVRKLSERRRSPRIAALANHHHHQHHHHPAASSNASVVGIRKKVLRSAKSRRSSAAILAGSSCSSTSTNGLPDDEDDDDVLFKRFSVDCSKELLNVARNDDRNFAATARFKPKPSVLRRSPLTAVPDQRRRIEEQRSVCGTTDDDGDDENNLQSKAEFISPAPAAAAIFIANGASCAQQARDERDSNLSLTIERLTDYLDEAVWLPKQMSSMAEMMYT